MRRFRQLKKSQNLIRSVQSQSRQIISSIYAVGTDNDQLQFSQNQNIWNISPQNLKITVQQPTINAHQPLNHLLPLLSHLSKGAYVDICSFIFFDYNTIHIATQEQRIKINKSKKDKNKLRYWLSHVYFHKLRSQLTQQLIHSNKLTDENREVIHANEEKQYMPMMFYAKKQASAFVRKIKVSPQAMYSKQGQLERQPFCVAYFQNGAQQLFSFTQILSFIQYPFNLTEISYFRILPDQKDTTPKFKSSYSKLTQTPEQKQTIKRVKNIVNRQQKWMYYKEEYEELKSEMIKNKNFDEYAQLISLQMMGNLQITEFKQVKQLTVQWIIDSQGNARLSNCLKYSFNPLSTFASEELVTLYEKCYLQKSEITEQISIQKSFRVKKMKSQQKYLENKSIQLSLPGWRKSINRSQLMSVTLSSARRKAKSSIIRKQPNKKWIL